MGYRTENLDWEAARAECMSYENALVYMISRMLCGKTEQVADKINWEECTEARFFSEQGELHFFDYEGERKAVRVTEDEKEADCIDKAYGLTGKLKGAAIGQEVVVREYIEYDEDGQAVVGLTRLLTIR